MKRTGERMVMMKAFFRRWVPALLLLLLALGCSAASAEVRPPSGVFRHPSGRLEGISAHAVALIQS